MTTGIEQLKALVAAGEKGQLRASIYLTHHVR